MRIGLTGDGKGWLNGQEILRARNKDNLNLDAVPVRVMLRKGENTLLLRIAPTANFSALIVRFCDLKGNALTNLHFEP